MCAIWISNLRFTFLAHGPRITGWFYCSSSCKRLLNKQKYCEKETTAKNWSFLWGRMPGAYSEDLRWRIICYKFLLMGSDEEIAFQLFVCPRTVQRICQKFVLTGNVVAERAGRPVGTTTLHRHEEYIIMEAILKEPATRLHQLASTIQEQTGSEFDVSTLCRTLHRLGFTNKKVSIRITDTAYLFSLSNTHYCFWLSTDKRNCSSEKRRPTCSIQSWYAKSFASWTHFYWWDRNCKCCFFIISQSRLFVRKKLLLYKTFFPLIHYFFSDLIFLQDRTLSRQYDYSQKGQRAEVIRTRRNSQCITVISAIAHDGYLSIRVLNPGQRFNRIVFADFLRNDIVPILNPYNGRNARSVVVLGNKLFIRNEFFS